MPSTPRAAASDTSTTEPRVKCRISSAEGAHFAVPSGTSHTQLIEPRSTPPGSRRLVVFVPNTFTRSSTGRTTTHLHWSASTVVVRQISRCPGAGRHWTTNISSHSPSRDTTTEFPTQSTHMTLRRRAYRPR